MQESQEIPMSNHLDEVIAAVSDTAKKRIPNKLLQTALFQPPREKLHLCEEKAKSYLSNREYKQAIQELVRCVALTRICYGSSHWKLAEAYINLAQGYLQLKGMSLQAKQHAEKAKEILASSIDSPYHDNTDVFKCSIELFYTTGKALLALQKFKEALENLLKAERLSQEMLQCGNIIKEEWVEIQARIKLSFAQVYQGQKRSKEALPYYQKALEYTETIRDENSLQCVPVLRELAGAEQALGFHDAAVKHFLRAHLIILSKNPSPEEAADSAHCIAQAAVASGRHNHYRATMILRESLEAKVGAFGDFSPEVADTYRVLGKADLAQGNHSGAHMKLKKCVQIETFLYGSQDKRTLATQQTLDTLSKISEAAIKPRQSPKAKAAFCTSVPQYTVPVKAKHSVAD
ncbi:Tetratricopeptide repeat protein 23 [Lemmus lemmus]